MKMTKVDTDNDVDASGKCYGRSTCSPLKALDDPSVFSNPSSKTVPLSESTEKTNSGYSTLQYRYVVAFIGFCVYCELECYRIATSMSVVKMVNQTAVDFKRNLNGTIDSCPLNDPYTENFSEQTVEGEFNWSPQIQGYILSAGFFGYVVGQIPGAMLAEAYGAKSTIFNGVIISSLAHMHCPFAAWWNCYVMIAMQFLRGVGQGFLSPACSVIAAKWFPKPERGFLNSCIFQGYCVGSFIAYAISGALCSSTLFGGWPLVYFVYGGLGLVFSLCVHLFLYESPKEHPSIGEAELIYILENQENYLSEKLTPTPWRKIMTSVPVYAMTYSIFSCFWAMSQHLSEHPIFLANILHFTIQTNGVLNSIPFAFQALVMLLGSWVSKWLNTHGYVGVDKLRKACTMLYSLGYSISLLGMYFAGCNRVWSNVCSIIAFSFAALSVPGCVIVPADMAPKFAGSLFAFSNTIASSATFIFPLIVGAMIDVEESLEQWKKIFLLCIAVVMSSGVLFCIFGSAEVQPWNFPSTEDIKGNQSKDEVQKIVTKDITITIITSTYV